MKYLLCKDTRMKEGTTILPIERGNAILLVTNIPAQVCANCGEPYFDEETTRDIQELTNETLNDDVSTVVFSLTQS